jgi:hypothetical protein
LSLSIGHAWVGLGQVQQGVPQQVDLAAGAEHQLTPVLGREVGTMTVGGDDLGGALLARGDGGLGIGAQERLVLLSGYALAISAMTTRSSSPIEPRRSGPPPGGRATSTLASPRSATSMHPHIEESTKTVRQPPVENEPTDRNSLNGISIELNQGGV